MKFNPCSPFNRKSCHPVPVRTVAPGTDNQGTALSESAGKLLFTHPPLLQAGRHHNCRSDKTVPPERRFCEIVAGDFVTFLPTHRQLRRLVSPQIRRKSIEDFAR